MLQPLSGIPLNLVIESISGHKIIPFDKNDEKDVAVLQKLTKAVTLAGNKINATGIIMRRANEVGNAIEPFIKQAIIDIGYHASTPKAKSGKSKAMGYPDIMFTDEFSRTNYLECKTFNINNVKSSQRSFYLSPSEDFKVTTDAHHFVLTFEIVDAGQTGSNNIYKCKSWKILSLENLEVDVKYEFNSDNARLYSKDFILAEATFCRTEE